MMIPGMHKSPRDSSSTCSFGSGFTLLEILVAIALLGIAIVLELQLFSADLRAITASEEYVTAVQRAEAKMREVLDEEKLEERTWSEAMDNGSRADITVSGTLKERTEGLTVKVLEIDLTFYWKSGSKTRSITLRTMKVAAKKV